MGLGDRGTNKENSAVCGHFSSSEGGVSDSRTGWLGREDSNLRMVESKSGRTFNEINAYSEKSVEFALNTINRLACHSE
jgi:hypothetical protein